MKRRYLAALVATSALVPAAIIVAIATPGSAAQTPRGLNATPLTPASRASAAKSPTSQLAQTDPSLLNQTDAKPISVVIKMSYDGLATYTGDISGYAATSPAVTGRPLSGSAAEKRYESRLASLEDAFAGQLAKKVPNAKLGRKLRTVYGGIAATVPANKIAEILAIPGVVAIQRDELRKPLTDSSPGFIGATSLYPQLGGTANAGKGVIFGSLDSGVWPEHPSFADNGNLGAPPAKADGTPRTCDFGDNPLTPTTDVFACSNKLIGGAPFIDTYNAVVGGEVYPDSARDSDGHGTHTASTAAGDPVASTPTLGVDRGAINGIAPGAWVSVYKVCGADGCFSSDSAAAVGQAIKDGVNVINFSISGGTDPFTDPVELAFLDAYAAGVFVAASAGNDGPTAGTANHLSPWVTSVAASTQTRAFDSTLTLTAGNGDTATFHGASITAGAGPLPIVLASDAPYGKPLCDAPAPAGLFTGKIVVCRRGVNARVEKGYNVLQGGASGMILYNPTLADVETDNHWLPAVHLADGTAFVAFVGSHSGITASFTAGTKISGQGDVMAAFSSRGPGGLVLKPDITAPGVQILAGQTPTPDSITVGPNGQYYQAIAGTSMSSPHIAGSAVLVKALHPGWTPGQIKSALMTTATTAVVKEDAATAADPLDMGSGRVDLTVAGNPGLTFDETAANMATLGGDEVHAVDLNLPSVDAKVMPGTLVTYRTARNVTTRWQTYTVSTTAPANSSITVSPSWFSLAPGKTQKLKVTIRATAPTGQYFGQIKLKPKSAGLPTLHLPVAFVPQQGKVTLASSCAPDSVKLLQTSTCTVTATNFASVAADVTLHTNTSLRLPIVSASGAAKTGPFSVSASATLTPAKEGVPSVTPGSLFGYIPLDAFGIAPTAVGDEDILNFNTASFTFGGHSYSTVGVTSNGYLVLGGGTAEDVNFEAPPMPDPARPNNVVAPFWTDLNGTGAPGVFAASLSDGTTSWLVVEWRVYVYGTTSLRVFQSWIQLDNSGHIWLQYDPGNLPADPNGQQFQVGVENRDGSAASSLGAGVLPTQDLAATSSDPTAGGSATYSVKVLGVLTGTGTVATSMTTPIVPGVTQVTSTVQITH